MKEYSSFSKAPDSSRHQIVIHIQDTRGEGLTPLQRCSRCYLQLQPTGHSLGEFYPSAEMQSMYSAALTDWHTGHSLGSLTPLQRCSQCRCILQPPLPACWLSQDQFKITREWSLEAQKIFKVSYKEVLSVFRGYPGLYSIVLKSKNDVVIV